MKLIIFITAFLIFSACRVANNPNEISTDQISNPNSAQGYSADGFPEIQFENEELNFGQVSQGEKIDLEINFSNIGSSPLLITSVLPSCGCTLINDWPQDPIGKNEAEKINIQFNSEGKVGVQDKTVTIITNADPQTYIIHLKGEVIAPDLKNTDL